MEEKWNGKHPAHIDDKSHGTGVASSALPVHFWLGLGGARSGDAGLAGMDFADANPRGTEPHRSAPRPDPDLGLDPRGPFGASVFRTAGLHHRLGRAGACAAPG